LVWSVQEENWLIQDSELDAIRGRLVFELLRGFVRERFSADSDVRIDPKPNGRLNISFDVRSLISGCRRLAFPGKEGTPPPTQQIDLGNEHFAAKQIYARIDVGIFRSQNGHRDKWSHAAVETKRVDE
jgi:hypothetical protein